MTDLIDCQCYRYPNTPCVAKADAEDLLCSACRFVDCIIVKVEPAVAEFVEVDSNLQSHARVWFAEGIEDIRMLPYVVDAKDIGNV